MTCPGKKVTFVTGGQCENERTLSFVQNHGKKTQKIKFVIVH